MQTRRQKRARYRERHTIDDDQQWQTTMPSGKNEVKIATEPTNL